MVVPGPVGAAPSSPVPTMRAVRAAATAATTTRKTTVLRAEGTRIDREL
jgi:hypothetical protein